MTENEAKDMLNRFWEFAITNSLQTLGLKTVCEEQMIQSELDQ